MITGIVVVSYHNANGTSKYVTEQLARLSDDYRVVVVAVDADEKYGQKLAADCGLAFINSPKLVVQHSKGWCVAEKENLGYAKGNNLGVEILKNSGIHFEHYLFSNDDIEILNPNILNVLSSYMQECEQYAGIGPRIIGLDGKDQSPHTQYISPIRLIAWKLFPFLRSKKKYTSPVQYSESSKSIAETTTFKRQKPSTEQILKWASPIPPKGDSCYWISGAFMMVRADRFNIVEGFDPRTFLYYEEAILAERFIQHGWRFAFAPSVSVIHYEGGSTTIKTAKKDAIEMESRMLYYKEYKNEHKWILWLYKIIYKI